MTETVKPLAAQVNNLGRFSKTAAQKPAKKPAHSQSAPRAAAKPETWDFETIMDHLDEIPQVRGYRVMLIPVIFPETTSGGIVLPDEVRNRQLNHAQVFRVVGMGSQAYADPGRFPDGAFCEIGDYVLIGRYAGTKVTTTYCEDLRIVNDDEVMAIIPDHEKAMRMA